MRARLIGLILTVSLSGTMEFAAAEDSYNRLMFEGEGWSLEGDYTGVRYSSVSQLNYLGDFENASRGAGIAYRRYWGADECKPHASRWLHELLHLRTYAEGALSSARQTLKDERGAAPDILNGWKTVDDREFTMTNFTGQGSVALSRKAAIRFMSGFEHEKADFDIQRTAQQEAGPMINREISDVARDAVKIGVGIDLVSPGRAALSIIAGLSARREEWDGDGTLVMPNFTDGADYKLTAKYTGGDAALAIDGVLAAAGDHLVLRGGFSFTRQTLEGNSLSEFDFGPMIPGHFEQTLDITGAGAELDYLPVPSFRIGAFATLRSWRHERRERLRAGYTDWLFNEDWEGQEWLGGGLASLEIGPAAVFSLKAGFRRLDWERSEEETAYTKTGEGDQQGPLASLSAAFYF